jgi:hypothetical protein
VRRIQADEKHKQAAEANTYGTIKRLVDSDGDGQMDQSVIWADRLPPCLGICAVRGGIVAACKTQILFLADRNGDGQAELREVLFEPPSVVQCSSIESNSSGNSIGDKVQSLQSSQEAN